MYHMNSHIRPLIFSQERLYLTRSTVQQVRIIVGPHEEVASLVIGEGAAVEEATLTDSRYDGSGDDDDGSSDDDDDDDDDGSSDDNDDDDDEKEDCEDDDDGND